MTDLYINFILYKIVYNWYVNQRYRKYIARNGKVQKYTWNTQRIYITLDLCMHLDFLSLFGLSQLSARPKQCYRGGTKKNFLGKRKIWGRRCKPSMFCLVFHCASFCAKKKDFLIAALVIFRKFVRITGFTPSFTLS